MCIRDSIREASDVRDRRTVERQPLMRHEALLQHVKSLASEELRVVQTSRELKLADEPRLAEAVKRFVLHDGQPLHHLCHFLRIKWEPLLSPVLAGKIDEDGH